MTLNRRSLFKLLSAGAALLGAGVTVAPARRYGPMTFERHRRLCRQGVHLHVMHRGRDVSRRCTFADDTGDGMAELFIHNEAGKRYMDRYTNRVAKEIVYGVTFVEGEPF